MNYLNAALSAGLYFVGVPIGTARDITLRALDVLASADVLAAEDTRSLRRLMEIHGVPLAGRRIVAMHDHSGAAVTDKLLAAIRAGQSVAYASEAGMPLIADPGFELSRAVAEAGLPLTCAPGPSALPTALALVVMNLQVTESTSRLARARSCDFKQKSEQSVCIGLGVVSSMFQCSNLQKSRFCL